MKQYIDKTAVIAEIKRRLDLLKANENGVFHAFASEMIIIEYENMLSFLDTLEVKNDFKPLDSDFERDAVSFCIDKGLNTTPYIAKTIAKHFFELGVKTQTREPKKDCETECPNFDEAQGTPITK